MFGQNKLFCYGKMLMGVGQMRPSKHSTEDFWIVLIFVLKYIYSELVDVVHPSLR